VERGDRNVPPGVVREKSKELEMLDIKKQFVVDDTNTKRAVVLDIKTFEKIEEILEDYGLTHYMEEVEEEDALDIEAARTYYEELKQK
jgi:hypothetical protein